MNKTIRPEDPRFLAALNRAWIEVTRTREPAGDPEKLTKWVRWPGERCAPASHDFVAGFVAGTTFVESHLESQACSTASSPRSEGSCAGAGGTGGSSAPPAGVEEQEKAPTGTEHAGPAPAAAVAGEMLPPAEMPLALLPYWTPQSRVYREKHHTRENPVWWVYGPKGNVAYEHGFEAWPAQDEEDDHKHEPVSNRHAPAKACECGILTKRGDKLVCEICGKESERAKIVNGGIVYTPPYKPNVTITGPCECGGTADPALCQRRDCARKVK